MTPPRQAALSRGTSLLAEVEAWVGGVPGWSPVDQLHALYMLATSTAALEGDIVEVGAWCGRSSVVLGRAAAMLGNTRLHAVDLFPDRDDWTQNDDASWSFSVTIDGQRFSGYQDQTVWDEPFQRDIVPVYERSPVLMETFRETLARHDLGDVVRAHRGDLRSFLSSQPSSFRARLIFLDGDHGFEAVCDDIRAAETVLADGGWLCFDDALSSYDGVDRAIEELVLRSGRYDPVVKPTRKMVVAQKRRLAR
jgi:predicted O-methyltransferase YrrM